MKPDEAGLVVLNYITVQETREVLDSALSFYPGLRTIVVDNGSPGIEFSEMMKKYPSNVSSLKLDSNLGFARGLNEGISALRREGYGTVICSSSDILFFDGEVVPLLAGILGSGGVAVAGPSVITPKWRDQSPLLRERPDMVKAKKMVGYYGYGRIISRYALNRFVLGPIKKRFRKPKEVKDLSLPRYSSGRRDTEFVYAINGAFFALGPRFFEYFKGLDPHTFLYGEELILGEMVYRAGLKTAYVPSAAVFHKEDRTSSVVWGSEDRIKPAMIASESIRHWYEEHYLPA